MALNRISGESPKQHRMRAAERHEAHGLRCPLGELIDLSATGLRCKCSGKPSVAQGAVIPLVLQNSNQTIRLMARVVWVRKVGLITGEWQAGLYFLDVRPGIKAAIEQFAKYGFIQDLGSGASGLVDLTPTTATTSNSTSTTSASSSSTTGSKSSGSNGGSAKTTTGNAGTNGTGASSSSSSKPTAEPKAGPRVDPAAQRFATVEIEDLYQHLGLTIDASESEIVNAYRAIAKQLHPDQNQDPAAAERFIFINKAYGVLRDTSKRAKYDMMLRASQQGRMNTTARAA
jgi:hypothetical protein